MERLDFASVMAVLRRNIPDENFGNQTDFLHSLFLDVNLHPQSAIDFDQGQVCRWINGLARLSPNIISFYQDNLNQRKLVSSIKRVVLPLMPDSAMAAQELYDLVLQAPNVSPQKKMELTDGYTFEDENDEAIFIMEILCLAMQLRFEKRDVRKKQLLTPGNLSPAVVDYIFDTDISRPCRWFLGRETELEQLHTLLVDHSKVFLQGIPGIGKSELAKAYAKQYGKNNREILLHPMIREVAVEELKPSVNNCSVLLDSLQEISLMHGLEFVNNKQVFHTVESIITTICKDDSAKYLLFLENVFQYMDKYRYEAGMQAIIEEMTTILSDDSVGTSADRACLLDARAVLEKNTKKQIELVEEAIRVLGEVYSGNAHLAANLHANLGALYHKAGRMDIAKLYMEQGVQLLEEYNLTGYHDSVTQICNYAALITDLGETQRAYSALLKLARTVKELNSDQCLDYPSLRPKGQSSLIPMFLLSPQRPFAFAGPLAAVVFPLEIVRAPRGLRLLQQPMDNATALRICCHCPRSWCAVHTEHNTVA